MSEESERRARTDAFKQLGGYLLDSDPQTASMGRLLVWMMEWHSEWIADEQQRGTEATHALDACIEAYMMLIHSVAQMTCTPENLEKVEELVLHKMIATWKRTSTREGF